MNAPQFKTLNVTLTKEDYEKAKMFADLKVLCFNFLGRYSRLQKNVTNFTNNEVDHDYYIRFIATFAFKKQLSKDKHTIVSTWEDAFDIVKVISILCDNLPSEEDIAYIYSYFCSQYHVKIKNGEKEMVLDIKTALTKLEPKINWNFLFSARKAETRENTTALLYCVGNKLNIRSVVFSGVISYNTVRQCPVLKKGQVTRFGTVNKIDNYVTTLSKDYVY